VGRSWSAHRHSPTPDENPRINDPSRRPAAVRLTRRRWALRRSLNSGAIQSGTVTGRLENENQLEPTDPFADWSVRTDIRAKYTEHFTIR